MIFEGIMKTPENIKQPRVFNLRSGDVFTLHNKYTIMYKDDQFKEVESVEIKVRDISNGIPYSYWTTEYKATGRIFTTDELNALN